MARFTILGSGSAGNCAYLETDQARILIDAGFSGRQIAQRLEKIGRRPEDLTAIILTHEHSDHVQGLNVLCNRYQIPLYCNRLTKEAIADKLNGFSHYRLFPTGGDFMIGDIGIETFSVPHDAYDPVGFALTAGQSKIGFLTDLGYATRLVMERVRESNIIVLETNYDLKLLQNDTKRPWAVKQRILSRHGHLSNESAAELAKEIVTDKLRRLYLGHLSRDCNSPELAHHAVSTILSQIGAMHVSAQVTDQDQPCATIEV